MATTQTTALRIGADAGGGRGGEEGCRVGGENREATPVCLFPVSRIIKQVFQSQGPAVKEGAVNVRLYGVLTKEKSFVRPSVASSLPVAAACLAQYFPSCLAMRQRSLLLVKKRLIKIH